MSRLWEIINDDMSSSESSVDASDTYDVDALTAKLHLFDDCHFGGHESKVDFLNIPGSRSESMNFDDSLYLDVRKISNDRGIEAFHHSGALESLFSSPTRGDENKPKEPTKKQRRKGAKEACDFVKCSSPTEKEQVVTPMRGSKRTIPQSKGKEDFMSTYFKEVKVGSKPQQRNSRSTLSKVRRERTSPSEVSSNSPLPGPPQRSYVVPLTISEPTNSPQGSSQKGKSKDLDSSTHSYTRKRSSRRRAVKDLDSFSHSQTRQRSSSRNTRGTEHRGSVDVNRSLSPVAPSRRRSASRDLSGSTHSTGGDRRRLQQRKNTSERRGAETGRPEKSQHSPTAGIPVQNHRKPSVSIIKSPDQDDGAPASLRSLGSKLSDSIIKSLYQNDDGAPASSRSLDSKPSDCIIKSPDQNDDGAPASSRSLASESRKHRTTTRTRNSRGGEDEEDRRKGRRVASNRKSQDFRTLLHKSRSLSKLISDSK
jgi:hypothetical protein